MNSSCTHVCYDPNQRLSKKKKNLNYATLLVITSSVDECTENGQTPRHMEFNIFF